MQWVNTHFIRMRDLPVIYGTWEPEVVGSVSDPTATYSLQEGHYTQVGDRCFFEFDLRISSISGGSGSARVTLPLVAAKGVHTRCACSTSGVEFGATPGIGMSFGVLNGSNLGAVSLAVEGSGGYTAQVSDLSSGSIIQAAGQYRVNVR